MSEQSASKTSKEGIAAIIMIGVVSVVCILACAAVFVTFLINPPW
jgi:flagellar basal body-associated protein FliL